VNILCDFHHADLWWSNHLIFEAALGHTLFRPRGMDWFERGYYHQRSKDVAKQFLVDSMFTLSDAEKYPGFKAKLPQGSRVGLRASMDTIVGCEYYPFIKTLSFDEFADEQIDVIMTTLSDDQEPWFKLRKDYKPKAKLLREEGNINGWASLHPEYKNVLTSDFPTFLRIEAPNKVLYHQRFDTKRVFTYSPPTEFERVTCLMPGFRGTPELVKFAEQHDLGKLEFVDYGHHSKNGFLSPKEKYTEAIRKSAFIWHVKPGGDGFGHVIHNSLAMGRPVITKGRDYLTSIAWPLLQDRKTCILIGDDAAENSRKIKLLSDPDTIRWMGESASKMFRALVDYDWEADQIQRFVERLQ
jgi:hypothetical protein